MNEGVLLHWLDSKSSTLLASDLRAPKASFLRNGSIVVASGRTFRIYWVESQGPVASSELGGAVDGGTIVDVVPGPAPNQFVALTTYGRMILCVLPSG